jgi:hypothetical protein
MEQCNHVTEKFATVDAVEACICVWKVLANVAKCSGT